MFPCEVSSKSLPNVKIPDVKQPYHLGSIMYYQKVPYDNVGMKPQKQMMKSKLITVSTQTDVNVMCVAVVPDLPNKFHC